MKNVAKTTLIIAAAVLFAAHTIGCGSAIYKYTDAFKTEWKTTASGIVANVGFTICL